MGAGHQKAQAMIRSLGFSAYAPRPILQRGRVAGNGCNDWAWLHAEDCIKILKVQGLESIRVGEASIYQEDDVSHSTGPEAPALRTLPDLVLCISLSGYSSHPLLYNKLVNVFPWVLWAILANTWTQDVRAEKSKKRQEDGALRHQESFID